MKLKTVGIEGIRYPIRIREKSGSRQETVATINLQASMPKKHRGNCISSFISILNKFQNDITIGILPSLIAEVKKELQAESAKMEITFQYFIEKEAPVTKTPGLMEYTCRFSTEDEDKKNMVVSVWVPSTTLCPCSKEISSFGAHNQRAEINLNVKFNGFIWLEDLIKMAEEGSSCQVYSVLKRPDEKFVTEEAYNNPMFVEDVVRKVAGLAMQHEDIYWFSVGVESFESIHKHSAYAFIDSSEI
jgi:GTP cyclohydrolase I